MFEYINNVKILSFDELIIRSLLRKKIEFEVKKKGKSIVCSNFDEKIFRNINRWVITEYKFNKLT